MNGSVVESMQAVEGVELPGMVRGGASKREYITGEDGMRLVRCTAVVDDGHGLKVACWKDGKA